MKKQEMINILQSIQHPIIADRGCFDSGYEFKILTPTEGIFASIMPWWPVTGPYRFKQVQLQSLKKLLGKGLEIDDIAELSDIEDLDLKPEEAEGISQEDIDNLKSLDEFEIRLLAVAIDENWPPDVDAYSYQDQISDEIMLFADSDSAHLAMIDEGIDGYGTPWVKMKKEELEEWCETLKNADEAAFPDVERYGE